MIKLTAQLKQGADQAWESLSEGWRELSARASGALTRFRTAPASNASSAREGDWLPFGGWSLMAADVYDDADKVIVRIEAPGMRREEFSVELHGDLLTVRGEGQFEKQASTGRYSVMQRAYGSFRRDVVLPTSVQADDTKAIYRDGVLCIEHHKSGGSRARRVLVNTT